jgi:hypothetical protein
LPFDGVAQRRAGYDELDRAARLSESRRSICSWTAEPTPIAKIPDSTCADVLWLGHLTIPNEFIELRR